jgi:hypothetical protein
VRSAAALLLALLCPLALSACGDTVQSKPVAHNALEGLLASAFPIYWVGGSFAGMQLTVAFHDPSGAYSVQYGPCVQGGQGTCTPALQVVTSPDNSFLPGGTIPQRPIVVRGLRSMEAQGGRTLVIPTGGVVVDVFADSPVLARAAARTMVPINRILWPGEPLPRRKRNTGFDRKPLASQVPKPIARLP